MVVLVFVSVRSGAGAQLSVELSVWRTGDQYVISTRLHSRDVSQSGDAHGRFADRHAEKCARFL